jgi:lipopolysaccharide/colanic/teichoic acid biosynthesis glycosyltransferase
MSDRIYLDLNHLQEGWLATARANCQGQLKAAMHRSLDLTCALTLLLATLPLLLLVALAIKLDSPGPIFYGQERIGRLLRLSRIDEIPQVLNVLRGDMAMVGPRPERPAFVAQLEQQIPHYKDRACVRPGITGWAQINYPYGASVEDARQKLTYDLYYIQHRGLRLDLRILLTTVRVVLFQQGAR